MHPPVQEYIAKIKERFPDHFKSKRVLEMGSLNINGTTREFFEGGEYIGIDHMEGKDVDVVVKAHEYDSEPFDVVVSTEMLEHDKYAEKSIANAMRLLKKGGLLIVTCASDSREPHYEWTGEENHYKNISRQDVERWLKGYKHEIEQSEDLEDIRFMAIK